MLFFIGMLVGAVVGVVSMCLVTIIPKEEDEWEDMFKKGENKDEF